MNRPIRPPLADHDIGPLDEHGQQIWSPEQDVASARMWADPAFLAGLEEAKRQAERGEGFTTDELTASLRERKRRWFAEKGIAPPPGYFGS